MKRKNNTPTSRLLLQAEASDNLNHEYKFRIEYYIFMEREVYIAYCPSLDISTSGENFNDAVKNFYECFQLHIEWCVEHNTLEKDLIAHGWKVNKTAITPPSFAYLLKKPEVRDLFVGDKPYEKVVVPARIAL